MFFNISNNHLITNFFKTIKLLLHCNNSHGEITLHPKQAQKVKKKRPLYFLLIMPHQPYLRYVFFPLGVIFFFFFKEWFYKGWYFCTCRQVCFLMILINLIIGSFFLGINLIKKKYKHYILVFFFLMIFSVSEMLNLWYVESSSL